MDKVPMEDVNAALNEQKAREAEEVSSASEPEVEPKVEPKVDTVPKYRLDEVISQRKDLEAKLSEAETKLSAMNELEQMGYSVSDIKDYISSMGDSSELAEVHKKNEVNSLKNEFRELKLKTDLRDYIESNPKAKTFSNSLVALKKVFPHKSFEQLYVENFSSVTTPKEKVKVETGRGSIEENFDKGMTEEKFASLSTEDQAKYLRKIKAL